MSSPFLYRLRVNWSKNGKQGQEVIPVYAFKGGGPESLFPGEITNVETFRNIAEGAWGARTLTVCTFSMYAYRALENRSIDFFYLDIRDTRIATSPTEERKIVATITCNDMKGGNIFTINGSNLKMSCESRAVTNNLSGVLLTFFDSDGGPTFQRT